MVYILFGEDEARSRYKLETIKKNNTFDTIERYDLEIDSPEIIYGALDTFSLFDETSMVIVDNAGFLAGSGTRKTKSAAKSKPPAKRKTSKKKEKPLSAEEKLRDEFSKRTPEDKIIVFMVPAKALIKDVRDFFPSAIIMESKALDEKSLPGIVDEMLRERKMSMTPDAKNYFVQNVGLDTLKIASELDKLGLYSDHLQLTDVQALMIREPSSNVFAMTDALFEKRVLDLIGLYREFRFQNMEPVAINGLLASQIRFIFQVRTLLDLRCSQQEIADRLHTSSGRIYYSIKKANRFSAAELLGYLHTLSELDWNIKNGLGDRDAAFEDFFLRKLGKPGRRY